LATPPTAGKIYLLESTSGVDDWITDHSGDPDLIDFSLQTEGTHFCQFSFPMKFIKRGKTGMAPSTSSGGVGTSNKTGNKFYNCIIMGTTKNKTNADFIDKFIMDDRHQSPTAATFKNYYLVVYYGTNNHGLFTNIANARLSYAPGIITDFEVSWQEPKHVNFNVRINWWSQFIS